MVERGQVPKLTTTTTSDREEEITSFPSWAGERIELEDLLGMIVCIPHIYIHTQVAIAAGTAGLAGSPCISALIEC